MLKRSLQGRGIRVTLEFINSRQHLQLCRQSKPSSWIYSASFHTSACSSSQGKITEVGGVNAYVARPAGETRKAIVIATDAFGHSIPSMQQLADTYAHRGGFLVAVPDLFGGDPLPLWILQHMIWLRKEQPPAWRKLLNMLRIAPTVAPWQLRHSQEKETLPILRSVIADLREKHGIEKIGLQGYSWGVQPTLKLAQEPETIDAFMVAHGEVKVPSDIDPLQKPGLFIWADNDQMISIKEGDRRTAEEMLSARGEDKFQFQFFPGTCHGFALRGDQNDEVISQAKEEVIQLGLDFFAKHLQ